MKIQITFLVLILAICSCSSPKGNSENSVFLLIRNITVIDGKGNDPMSNMDILIQNNRIKEVGKAIEKPSNAKEIDGVGMTVLPGLIDSHVHISSVPGSGYRKDTLAIFEALQRHHLKAYLACGVTTILDPAIKVEEAKKLKRWIKEGQAGPRLLVLSPAFTAEGGYLATDKLGTQLFFSPVSNEQDIEDRLNESEELNAQGVKIFLESGFGFGRMPFHSTDILKAIKEKAALRNLPIYIHATAEKDILRALELEPHALTHGSSVSSDEAISKLLEKPVYLISTLSIMDSWMMEKDRGRLSNPYYMATVPQIELSTADNQAAWEHLNLSFAKMVLTDSASEEEIKNVSTGGNPDETLKIWLKNIKKLYEAGLPIVMGSDAGNWSIYPQFFHGPTSIREIELLVLAGLPPLNAIQSSTSVPAEMLGLSEDIGTIEEGKIADLIIVAGDPLRDIQALRNIKWTIQDGVAKKSEQWMD